MLRVFLLLAISLSIVGCSNPFIPLNPPKSTMRSYTIGETLTTPIGAPIVTVQSAVARPGWVAIKDYDPPQRNTWDGGADYPPIRRGTVFGVVATRADSVLQISTDEYALPPGAAGNAYAIPYVLKIPIWPNGVVADHPLPFGKDWTTDTLFAQKTDGPMLQGGAFKAEIIYSGLTGNTVRAVYREYVNDYARPAFSTELQYNLDESKIIAYRSIKIQVLTATNSSLCYSVISDDNLPWVK